MRYCKDCGHICVCKYTDAGDGRCQKPQHFMEKNPTPAVVKVSPKTMDALRRMGETVHRGAGK